MNLPKSFTAATPISKVLALVLLILLPFGGFYCGIRYQQQIESIIVKPPSLAPNTSYRNGISSIYGIHWEVTSYLAEDNLLPLAHSAGSPNITINQNQNKSGSTLGGYDGCNHFVGTYKSDQKGSIQFKIGPVDLALCINADGKNADKVNFTSLLSLVKSYEIIDNTTLLFRDDKFKTILTLKATN